jgi:hypothetical protein
MSLYLINQTNKGCKAMIHFGVNNLKSIYTILTNNPLHIRSWTTRLTRLYASENCVKYFKILIKLQVFYPYGPGSVPIWLSLGRGKSTSFNVR